MKTAGLLFITIALLLNIHVSGAEHNQSPDSRVIRAAVIGGMASSTMLWQEIARMFERDTGYRVETTASGPISRLVAAVEQGQVDIAVMHSSDATTDLVADGYATNLRPWARNDMVIYGPSADPAGIAGLDDGGEAFARIAATESSFIDVESLGARSIAHDLWSRAGITPAGPWYLQDENPYGDGKLLQYAAEQQAYIIVGRIPVITGKQTPGTEMEILVDSDPTMRRPYMVMEVRSDAFSNINRVGAARLADYLLSERVQEFLSSYDGGTGDGVPLFHPVFPPARDK